jgi:uncharacterized protein (DUF2132 family)
MINKRWDNTNPKEEKKQARPRTLERIITSMHEAYKWSKFMKHSRLY